MSHLLPESKQPKKAQEPTTTAVTPRATESISEMKPQNPNRDAARPAPAPDVGLNYLQYTRMKTLRIPVIITAALLVVAVSIGANSIKPDQPYGVPSERWVATSPVSGFVIGADVADPKALFGRSDRVVGATLWVKTQQCWMRARIDNPLSAVPLTP